MGGCCSGPLSRSRRCTTRSCRTTSRARWGGDGSRWRGDTQWRLSTRSPGSARSCSRSSHGGPGRSRKPRTPWWMSSWCPAAGNHRTGRCSSCASRPRWRPDRTRSIICWGSRWLYGGPEVPRQFHGVRFAHPDERVTAVERTTDLACRRALLISPPELAHTPAMFRRLDGSSRFQFRGLETYATRETLDAEARLLEAGRCLDGPGVQAESAAVVIEHAPVGRRLPVGQTQVVQDVVASGRVLDVLVGAAGTGKSTIMAGVREVWEGHYGPGSVIGLAPSAAAAEVLSQVAGIPSENTAKWLTENARNALRFEQIGELQARLRRASPSLGTRAATGKLRALIGEYRQWSLRPGQLIIVDEASMAGTFDLDTLTTQAWQAGAKVLLVAVSYTH